MRTIPQRYARKIVEMNGLRSYSLRRRGGGRGDSTEESDEFCGSVVPGTSCASNGWRATRLIALRARSGDATCDGGKQRLERQQCVVRWPCARQRVCHLPARRCYDVCMRVY